MSIIATAKALWSLTGSVLTTLATAIYHSGAAGIDLISSLSWGAGLSTLLMGGKIDQ